MRHLSAGTGEQGLSYLEITGFTLLIFNELFDPKFAFGNSEVGFARLMVVQGSRRWCVKRRDAPYRAVDHAAQMDIRSGVVHNPLDYLFRPNDRIRKPAR